MRFTVLGAGGVGGYYGALLARAGNDVAFLARGANLAALRERGAEIRTPADTPGERFHARIAAYEDAARLPPCDVAIVAVKSYALDDVAPAARRAAEGGAAVLPLLNGVDIVDRLAASGVPRDALLAGLTYISAVRAAPGVFERRSPFQRVVVGEPEGAVSERARAVAAAFAHAGADATASGDIALELWRKFVFLVAMSAACGLSRAPIGALRERPLGPRLLERAVAEAAAVARARGVPFDGDEERGALERLRGLPGAMKPSFLLDVEAGGATELDTLSGAVARLGAAAGIETPIHDAAVAALGGA